MNIQAKQYINLINFILNKIFVVSKSAKICILILKLYKLLSGFKSNNIKEAK